ncbi:hypothetical protein FRC08_009181 [Ceratobasidium sp. 394]|nr:hypothetical protein FRC08_009181 [Ceratobasidium sp. 394]
MSLLFKQPKRHNKRFRVAPYTSPSAQSASQSLLLSGTSSVSGRALDKRTANIQNAYENSLKGRTPAEKEDIEMVREEIAGLESGAEVEHSSYKHHTCDGDEGDWVDDEDQPFNSISVAVASQSGEFSLAQSWSERLGREQYSWSREMDILCDALLAYLRTGAPSPTLDDETVPIALRVTVPCINLTTKQKTTFTSASGTMTTAQLLMYHGYIAPTPSAPSIAIHVDVLRYCVAIRRHASLVSLEGLTSAICEVHNTLYAPHFRSQLTSALDVYLALTRMVEARLAKSMSRDGADWRMANACAACSYRLKDEPVLNPSAMFTCDGNESMKRVASASVSDSRTFEHDYFLDDDYVDHFKNETRRNKNSDKTSMGEASGDLCHDEASKGSTAPSLEVVEDENTPCEQRWKNARADDQNGKKLVVFDETGVFVVSCRHGTVMLVEDMRRSGELSKYGLAAVDRLIRIFGDDIMIGYDIGCTFRVTALRSPLVGPLVRKHRTRFAVGSFHGYAHERKCQISNHPLYIEGAGLESFEQNEQLFSSTNTVARTTRHASRFHRRQHFALRLSAWDFGRRCKLGSLLKTRYKKALDILATLPKEIEKICPKKTGDEWHAMFKKECEYFKTLKAPSPESTFAMRYLKSLRILAEKEKLFSEVFSVTSDHTTPAQMDTYHKLAAKTRKIEARRTAASEQLTAAQVAVAALEEEHSIHPRWTPGCPEWEAAARREAEDHYHEKLRELELLVVQRIAELEKAHLIGTGYKVHQQIQQAITRREKTITTALDRYNDAACALDPPRPTLTFAELTTSGKRVNFHSGKKRSI